MKRKKATSIPLNGKMFFAILSCIILAFFLSACGGGGESTSGSYTSDTGAVAFSVELPDQSNESSSVIPQSYGSSNALKPAALDCGSSGIVNITAELYEATGEHIIDAGPWTCSAHSGVMDNIPVGENRTLHVYGKDGDGNVLYMGVTTGIDVVAGQTTIAGTEVLGTAMYMSIDSAYLQYRVYWDGVNDPYRGYVLLTKFGEPVDLDDILSSSEIVSITNFSQGEDITQVKSAVIKSKIKVKNSSGTEVPIASAGFWRVPYFRADSPTSSADYTGPYTESGIYMTVDAASIPAGNYTFELTTSKGDAISKTTYFPGQTSLPFVQDRVQEWVGNDLHLSWSNPGGNFDQYRIVLQDQTNNPMVYIKLLSSASEITIPAQVVQDITDTFGPFVVRWQMETRSYVSDNNYARSYSNSVDINMELWPSVTVPSGKYDLMEYFPLSAGSWSEYYETDTCDNYETYRVETYYGRYAKGLRNVVRYNVDKLQLGLFNFDGQYFYYHQEVDYDIDDPEDYGITRYEPSIKIKRFLQINESSTTSTTKINPDGDEHSFELTFKLLDAEVAPPLEASFSDCLKIEQTNYTDGIFDERGITWWCKDPELGTPAGEVLWQETEDPQDPCLETAELTDYYYEEYYVAP